VTETGTPPPSATATPISQVEATQQGPSGLPSAGAGLPSGGGWSPLSLSLASLSAGLAALLLWSALARARRRT
jgi:hypothetical protein